MQSITGYHVYTQNSSLKEYYQINLLVQLASILFWKQNYGPLKLYTDPQSLKILQEYNLDVLYDDYDINSTSCCYYTFPRRLTSENCMQETEIIDKINNNFWDLIIYGKVGPDEFCSFPLYQTVKSKSPNSSIIF